jgi:hypothetical protein
MARGEKPEAMTKGTLRHFRLNYLQAAPLGISLSFAIATFVELERSNKWEKNTR